MIRAALSILFCFCLVVAAKTQVYKSNIYLFDLKSSGDTLFEFKKPRYLTDFNKNGYNNQPEFFSSDELYFSSREPYEDQTDIYAFDLRNKTKLKVTSTSESEFSPNRMLDYYNFSVVRQEISGSDTLQRIWQFPVDRFDNGKPVFKYIDDVGYYHWLNSYQIALFKVDRPNELVIANTNTDRTTHVAFNIGRCLKSHANGTKLYYVQKSEFEDWKIMEYDVYNKTSYKVIETITGSEDFVILPGGVFLMAKGSKIYKYKYDFNRNRYQGGNSRNTGSSFQDNSDDDWTEIADLRYYDIRNITRMAFSIDGKIALVAD